MILAWLELALPGDRGHRLGGGRSGPPGNLAQTAFFETLRAGDPEFADRLHGSNQPKPYAAWVSDHHVGVSVFDDRTFQVFIAGAQSRARMIETTTALALKVSARSARFEFQTPTAFSRGGTRFHVLPDIESVFRSLSGRWQRWLPIALPDLDYRQVRVADVQIELAPHVLRHHGEECALVGLVGHARYVCDGDADQQCVFGALAAFARFSGIGRHTGAGMGHVEVKLEP